MQFLFSLTALQQLPTQVRQASFSIPDTLFLVVIALIVFGPKKLPEISRQLGKLLYEFRRASNDFKLQIEEELRIAEQAERQKQLATQTATPAPATAVAISAEESVSAAPALEPFEEHTIAPPSTPFPSIQPPANGSTVSAPPPNRFSSEALHYGSAAPVGESFEPSDGSSEQYSAGAPIDELLVAAREAGDNESAVRETEAPVYAPGGETPVHHG